MGYAKNRVRNFMGSYFSFIGLLLVVIIFHVLTEGRLISSRNMMNIFNNFFSIGLGSVGVMFLMSLGELDLSVGAILGFSAAIGAFSAEIHTVWILPACLRTSSMPAAGSGNSIRNGNCAAGSGLYLTGIVPILACAGL